MPDYKKMYFQLAARVADAIDALILAQQDGEDEYIKGDGPVRELKTAREPEEQTKIS